jgi:hypothetical protein
MVDLFHVLVFLTALVSVSLDKEYTRVYYGIQDGFLQALHSPSTMGNYFRARNASMISVSSRSVGALTQ